MSLEWTAGILGSLFAINITLILFNLGLPSIILQLTIPVEWRWVVLRHRFRVFRPVLLLVAFLLFSAGFFLWVLFPCRDVLPKCWTELCALLLIGLDLAATFAVWYTVVGESLTKRVVRVLGGILRRDFTVRAELPDRIVDELVHIGAFGDAGHEKTPVLRELNRVVTWVQEHGSYKGCSFAHLRSACEVVLGGSRPGSDENFRMFAATLRDALYRLRKRGFADAIDCNVATELLRILGSQAVKDKSLETFLLYLDAAGDNSRLLFEYGAAAMSVNRNDAARTVLSRLEWLAERSPALKADDTTADFLGLLAHYWTSSSESTKKVATSYIEENRDVFRPSYWACVDAASEYHLNLLRFETVDKLAELKKV